MRRRTEFKKDMRHTSSTSSPRFSRTFDLLLSRFSDSVNLSINSNCKASPIMASNNDSYDSPTANKPGRWRPLVASPLCAFCNKSVYPAEEVIGAGRKYHRFCLKCTTCGTLLTTGSLTEREKKIYCEGCYRRQFGPRILARGLPASLPTSLETPPTSPNSNREDLDSMSSDIYNTDDENYNRRSSPAAARVSFDGSSSSGQLVTSRIEFNSDIMARKPAPTYNRPTSDSVVSGAAFKTMSISGGNVCPRCSKTVYSAEEVKAIGKSFHRQCYRCAHCKGSISGGRFSEHDGEIYDNKCYQRLFGPKGTYVSAN